MSEGDDNKPGARQELAARQADAAVAALFMLLGLYICFVSLTTHEAFRQAQVGPGVLPFFIGATLILTSAWIMLRLRRRNPPLEEGIKIPTATEAARAGILLVVISTTVVLIPILGTLVSLGLFVLVETLLLERRDWRLSLATAVLIPALLYVFFEAVLGVPLPTGLLGFM